MRKILLVIFSVSTVSACAPKPLTSMEMQMGVAQRHIIRTCYSRGQIRNQAAVVSYLNTIEKNLSQRANQAEVNAATTRISSAMPVSPQSCQQVELLALQSAQKQAQQDMQRAEDSQALENLNRSMQNLQRNTAQSMPRTTFCQHYQWGNMTSCNSF